MMLIPPWTAQCSKISIDQSINTSSALATTILASLPQGCCSPYDLDTWGSFANKLHPQLPPMQHLIGARFPSHIQVMNPNFAYTMICLMMYFPFSSFVAFGTVLV
jgi:hypothetical protein